MSYDFFNVGILAYGKKLAAVFDSLSSRAKDVDKVVKVLIEVLEYYDQYIGRNYKAPFPTRQDLPVRTNELFDLIGKDYQIKKMEYSGGEVHMELYYVHPDTHVITMAKGHTTLRNGYAFYVPALWNNDMSREVRFSRENDKKANEILICKYDVDSNNELKIAKFGTPLTQCQPWDYSQVIDMAIGETISPRVNSSYTATDYECVLIKQIGEPFDWNNINKSEVKLNGTTILWDNSRQCCNAQVLYLKPNDVITGTFEGFKIKYLNDRS